jgi:hypothetical protein
MNLNIINKQSIHPIIIPILYFKDIYNQDNSFFEMNPSLHINEKGNVVILIRNIDYRIFDENKFTIYNHPTNSIYMIMTGSIIKNEKIDIEKFTLEKIDYNYDLPIYPTFWKGMEDIRFINETDILVTVPECNKNGNPCIFKATITNNKIHSFKVCLPNKIEKNWMPFLNTDGKNKVVYSLDPFLIKSIEEEEFEKWELEESVSVQLKCYHGSTNGIHYNNYYWFLIHIRKERIYHKWIRMDIINKQINVSKEFVFFAHSYVEFPTNLCLFNNRIFISLGVNDIKAFIIEIALNELENYF